MRIIEYIKWTYKRQDILEKFLTAIVLAMLLGAILSFWFGSVAFAIAIIAICSVFVLSLMVEGGKLLYGHWQKFNRLNPPEDVRIMNKLRGHDDKEPNSGYY